MHKLAIFEKWLIVFGVSITLWLGLWTACYHLITFGGITWQQVTVVKWPLAAIISFTSLALAWHWLNAFNHAILSDSQSTLPIIQTQTGKVAEHFPKFWVFCALALVVVVLLGYHRSDFDDGEYLQLALQTMRHPELVPHTFDASLGELREPLRFAPYRAASYETLVAFVSEVSTVSVLNVYYQLIPLITGLASCAVAYAFLRWLHPHRLAAVGLLIFVLICLAWGEAHVAYGNRMFVRLFQGKGLLVALTTPMTLLAGLAVMRRPDGIHALVLFLSTAAAVGASSSGLIVSLVTLGMLGLIALFNASRVQLFNTFFIFAFAGCYPIAVSAWLKLSATQAGVTEAIGTVLPIHASFGSTLRMTLCMVIVAMATGLILWNTRRDNGRFSGWHASFKPALTGQSANSTWLLLVIASLALPLNPLVADFFANIGARNMSWRLAWAAPVPLLLVSAVLWIATELNAAARQSTKPSPYAGLLTSAIMLGVFLSAGGWAIRTSNNGTWDWPGAKLPPEATQADQLGHQIKARGYKPSDGSVLLDPRLAAWLPVSHPDIRLVMPGHGYPITFSTTMPVQEYAQRMELMQPWKEWGTAPNFKLDTLEEKYNVVKISKTLSR